MNKANETIQTVFPLSDIMSTNIDMQAAMPGSISLTHKVASINTKTHNPIKRITIVTIPTSRLPSVCVFVGIKNIFSGCVPGHPI